MVKTKTEALSYLINRPNPILGLPSLMQPQSFIYGTNLQAKALTLSCERSFTVELPLAGMLQAPCSVPEFY